MPRPSVFACFLCPLTSAILLVQTRGGKWSLPGGRCYRREEAVTALRREVREETGFTISVNVKPQLTWNIRRRWRRRGRDAVVYLFRDRPDVFPAAEVEAVGWFPLDALPTKVTRTALATVAECLKLNPALAESAR